MPFIMLTVLIDMISIGLIIPVLPALVGTFTHSQTEQAQAFRLVAVAFGFFQGRPLEYAVLGVVIFVSMLWTHRGNLERIVKRKENQV